MLACYYGIYVRFGSDIWLRFDWREGSYYCGLAHWRFRLSRFAGRVMSALFRGPLPKSVPTCSTVACYTHVQ
jgi:hypothetical protein